MRDRTAAIVLAAGLWAAAALAGRPVQAAQAAEPPNVPNVYGPGILLAFSGLDGQTSAAAPFAASTAAGGIVLKFHVPRDPVLTVTLAEGQVPEWQVVANDLLLATVAGDAVPLVIALPSSNVLVGRLPRGARVSLRGGDAGAVLLRNAVGDRTVFAFAYDPAGAKQAAEAASTALRVSIDTLAEARTDFFADAPKPPENTPPARARALAKAFSVLKANVYSPEPPITVRWSTPSRWPFPHMQLWDSAFNSVGLMHLDPKVAKETLEAVYECQGDDGFIAKRLGPGQTSEISQPPILGWTAWQIFTFDRGRDREFLKRSFDAASKHVTWFMKKRRLEGEPPPNRPLEFGTPLYAWTNAEESGAENSPRFAGGAGFAAIDLSCYLVSECRALQNMAQRLGYGELAKTWGQRGDALAAAAGKHLWNAERGFFFDRKADGEWGEVWSAAGLLPLWAGIATPDQAARLRDHVKGPKFRAPAGVTTVARDDPKFKKDMWAGPTWANVNYLVVRGLQRYGFEKEAADLRAATLDTVAKWYARTGCLYEFYDPDDQAPPAELARTGAAAGDPRAVIPDYAWTAAVYVDLLLRPKP